MMHPFQRKGKRRGEREEERGRRRADPAVRRSPSSAQSYAAAGGRTGAHAVVPERTRSYRSARGRTQQRAVVPSRARSYLRGLLRYDRADSRTTSRRRVRPREPGYDHASPGTTAWTRVRPRALRVRPREALTAAQRRTARPGAQFTSRSGPEDAQGLRISPSSLTRAMAIPWRGAVRSNRLTKSPARGQLTEMYMYCGANP